MCVCVLLFSFVRGSFVSLFLFPHTAMSERPVLLLLMHNKKKGRERKK